jgi:hypothetical protein
MHHAKEHTIGLVVCVVGICLFSNKQPGTVVSAQAGAGTSTPPSSWQKQVRSLPLLPINSAANRWCNAHQSSTTAQDRSSDLRASSQAAEEQWTAKLSTNSQALHRSNTSCNS